LLGNNNDDATDDFITPEGNIETNAHAFGEKWRVIDQVMEAGLQNEEPYVDTKPFVDQCETNKKKRAESKSRCSVLKEGIFKSMRVASSIFPDQK
jgi:hypothetical protein